MFHSVTINGKNSWTDYHMVPVEGIYLPPSPEQKITTIDLKASNGTIDISTLLTGYPVFNNRQGDLQYYILEPSDYGSFAEVGGTQNIEDLPSAYEVYSQILEDIHSTTGTMYFEDDPQWEYKGKFTVTSFSTVGLRRNVTIHYEVYPYKYYREQSTYTIDGAGAETWQYITLGKDELGTMPNNPIVTVAGLGSDVTGTSCIWYPPYTQSSRRIEKTTGNITFKAADFLFYKEAKLGFAGPVGSSATFSFYKGRL